MNPINQVDKLHTFMMSAMRIKCSSQKRTKKNLDTSGSSGKETFQGAECVKLMDNYQQLLRYVYSEDFLPTPPTEANMREAEAASHLWEALCNVHVLLLRKLPTEGNSLPSTEHRRKASEEFREVAQNFATRYRQVRGKGDRCMYVHVVSVEVPQFIMLYGNLSNYSAQGAEHMHVHTKFAMRWLTCKHRDKRVTQAFRWVILFNYHQARNPKSLRPKRVRRENNTD